MEVQTGNPEAKSQDINKSEPVGALSRCNTCGFERWDTDVSLKEVNTPVLDVRPKTADIGITCDVNGPDNIDRNREMTKHLDVYDKTIEKIDTKIDKIQRLLQQLGGDKSIADETKTENKEILLEDARKQLKEITQQLGLAKKGVSNEDEKESLVYKLNENAMQLEDKLTKK